MFSQKTIIDTPAHRMTLVEIRDGILHTSRCRCLTKHIELKQSLTNYWIIFRLYNIKPGTLFMKYNGRSFSISGDVYVFFPPYAYVEWNFAPGVYEYESFTSFSPADPRFPKEPTVIPFDKTHDIRGYSCIADIIIKRRHAKNLVVQEPDYVSFRAKRFVDRFFREDIAFSEMANELKMSHMTMTTGFRKQYGITLVQYRNILRAFEAKRLIKETGSVTQAGIEAGFKSMTQYNQHFHRTFQVPPSAFLKLSEHREQILKNRKY